MLKSLWAGLMVLVFLAVLTVMFGLREQEVPAPVSVATYEECVAAGYPVMESYPARCTTPDGQTFTQEIGNELEKSDLIRIDTPRPNQTVTSPLAISGQARGQWYFEATFPVRLLDATGNIIAESFATAQGDWMTDEFVPFTAEFTFTSPGQGEGILILEKSNPSGLPENADSLQVPVRFE